MASSQRTRIVQPAGRTVVVVGPDAGCDVSEIARSVAAEHGELLLLATGWPLCAAQQRVIGEAMDAAAALGLVCEARLVYREDEVEDHLLAGDTVVVPGSLEAMESQAVPTLA